MIGAAIDASTSAPATSSSTSSTHVPLTADSTCPGSSSLPSSLESDGGAAMIVAFLAARVGRGGGGVEIVAEFSEARRRERVLAVDDEA